MPSRRIVIAGATAAMLGSIVARYALLVLPLCDRPGDARRGDGIAASNTFRSFAGQGLAFAAIGHGGIWFEFVEMVR